MTLDEVTQEAVAEAETLHERWEAGDLTDEEFVALAAGVVLLAKSRATSIADVTLARELSQALGSRVGPLGLTVAKGEPARLRQALTTITTSENPSRERVARLADNEPKQAAAQARGRGITKSRHTTGWTRQASGIACKACRGLTGTVLSKNTQMWRHTGCSCEQVPVTITRGDDS